MREHKLTIHGGLMQDIQLGLEERAKLLDQKVGAHAGDDDAVGYYQQQAAQVRELLASLEESFSDVRFRAGTYTITWERLR